MRAILDLILGTIQFKDQTFITVRDDQPAGLRRAALLVALVACIAGLGGLFGVRDTFRGIDPEQLRSRLAPSLARFESNPAIPRAFKRGFVGTVEAEIDTVTSLAELKTPIPRRLASLIWGVGGWLSRPFVLAGSWFGYALGALVVARLLGGKASLPRMLSTTALSNVPYLLNLLAFIPYCGGLLTFAAWAWSSVIFVKATALANEMPMGKAAVAWIVPGLLLVVLWSLIAIAWIVAFIALLMRATR